MIIISRQFVAFLLMVIFLAQSFTCGENKEKDRKSQTLRNDLLITVISEQEFIPIYGYLRISITIENPSDKPVKSHKRIGQGYHYLNIWISSDTTDKFNKFDPSWIPQYSTPPPPSEQIMPGECLSTTFIITGVNYDANDALLGISGKYYSISEKYFQPLARMIHNIRFTITAEINTKTIPNTISNKLTINTIINAQRFWYSNPIPKIALPNDEIPRVG